MSQALCLVDHAGLFASCLANTVSVRSILAWPWHRAALAVFVHCVFLLFPASSQLSTLMPHPSYWTPLPSPFFLLLGTRSPARLPHWAHHGHVYPHCMTHLCIPFMPPPLLVCCAPPLLATIKYPWSLLFFFIPIPLAIGAELRNPINIAKLCSSVGGDGVIWEEEGSGFIKEVQVPFG